MTDLGGIRAKFSEYIEIKENGASGVNKTIDWANGNIQNVDLTDDCTFAFINTLVSEMALIVNVGATAYDAIWPTNVLWEDGTSPNFKKDTKVKCTFAYDGTNYLSDWMECY